MSALRSRRALRPLHRRCLASAAYNGPQQKVDTSETPADLTPKQRRIIEEIIRVDQAGELWVTLLRITMLELAHDLSRGANWIYKGQVAVFKAKGQRQLADLVQVCASTFLTAMLL